MSDKNPMPVQERTALDPAVEALATNRKMFLGFLVKRLGNLTEAEDVLL